MGQKVNPHGLRVGVINGWNTQWYADKKEFSKYLKEDNTIRTFLKKKYYAAAISKILIERAASRIVVTIYTARPGVIIGKAGSEVETIKKDLGKLTCGKAISINIGSEKARLRRAARGGRGRGSAREAYVLQTFDEAGDRPLHARRRQGHQNDGQRPSRRRRNRKMRAVSRGVHSSSDASRGHRLRLRGSAHHIRYDRR